MQIQQTIYTKNKSQKSCVQQSREKSFQQISIATESNKIHEINYKIGPETKRRDPYECEKKIISLQYQISNLKQYIRRYEDQIKYKEQIQKKLLLDSEIYSLRTLFQLFINFREKYLNQPKKQNKNAFLQFKNDLKRYLNNIDCELQKNISQKSASNQSSYSGEQLTLQKYQSQILTLIQTINQKQQYIQCLENKLRIDCSMRQKQKIYNNFQSSQKIFLNSQLESNLNHTSSKLMNSYKSIRQNQVLMDLNNISGIPPIENDYKKSNQDDSSIQKDCDLKSFSSLKKKHHEFMNNYNQMSQIKEVANKKLIFRQLKITNQVNLKIVNIKNLNQNTQKLEQKLEDLDQVYKSYKILLRKYLELNNLCWMIICKLSNILKKEKRFGYVQYLDNVKYQINNFAKWLFNLKSKALSFSVSQLLTYIRLCEQKIRKIFEYNIQIYQVVRNQLT